MAIQHTMQQLLFLKKQKNDVQFKEVVTQPLFSVFRCLKQLYYDYQTGERSMSSTLIKRNVRRIKKEIQNNDTCG